jgi:hypothetical protein
MHKVIMCRVMPEGWGVPKIRALLANLFKSWCLSLHKRKSQSFLDYQMGMGTQKYKPLFPCLRTI